MPVNDQDLEAAKVSFVADSATMHIVVTGDDETSAPLAGGGSIDSIRKLQKNILGDYVGLAAAVTAVADINTGDETTASIKTKLGIATLSGDNTGDETAVSIETKLTDAGIVYATQSAVSGALAAKENTSNKVVNFNVVDDDKYPTTKAVKGAIDSALVGVLNDRGSWDASTGLFPTTGGSAEDGSIRKGNLWYVSVPGILGGEEYNVGDSFRALDDNPGQVAAKWDGMESNLGIVPYSASNPAGYTANESDEFLLDRANHTGSQPAASITESATKVFVTPAEKTAIAHANRAALDLVEGANTGDETAASIKSKLGVTVLSGSNTGDQTLASLGAEAAANKVVDFSTVNNTLYPSIQAVKTYLDARLLGVLNDRGTYTIDNDLTDFPYPSTGGSGTDGAVRKGDIWYVKVTEIIQGDPATIGTIQVNSGDTIRALEDAPGQDGTKWALQESNIGYVPVNQASIGQANGVAGLNAQRNIIVLTSGGNVGALLGTLSAGTPYNINLPAKSGTVAMTSDVGAIPTKVSMAANALDLSLGLVFSKTIVGNTTFTVTNVPAAPNVATIILDLTNGGLYTITWWAGIKWPNGTIPALTPNGRDKIGFITYDAGVTWDGFILGRNLS